MAKKKVSTPLQVFDRIVPTSPILKTLPLTGRVLSVNSTHVIVLWSATEFKIPSGYVRLPYKQKLLIEGVEKIEAK